MISETGKSNINKGLNKSSEEFPGKSSKNIETYSIIVMFCLTAAVLLISFNQRLFAGCLIIAGASIGVIVVRKALSQNKKFKESLSFISSLKERKDDVIIDFSHRIREPLNNLVVIVDMLMESGLQKKQKELFETLIASTNNMVNAVNELTMQSAVKLSFETRKPIPFNLISTIQNTVELYNLKDKTNIEFTLNKEGFTDFECFGDPIILKQIFLDLFNTIENQSSVNAINVTINLKKEKETGTESLIGFRIQTDRSIVFINDYDIERSLSARLITISKGTFSQMVGDNYTILSILLPFTGIGPGPKQKTAYPKIEELIPKDRTHKELKDLKILLVEDNPINQKITILTLKPLVNSIDTADNGQEALDKFVSTSYDLLLMDIQMPVMNGLIATEKIRALESSTNSHVPIIAITANAMIGDKENCISAGIDDYISKPFHPAALIDMIKKNI